MSYRLRVSDIPSGEYCNDFFERFMDECGYRNQDEHGIDHYLKPYRAKNVMNEPYIEFETEADATLFLLKWT